MIYILTLLIILIICFIFNYKYKYNIFNIKSSLELCDLPIIVLKYNGKKINFLVDSGSDKSYICKGVLDKNAIATENKDVSITASGMMETFEYIIDVCNKTDSFTMNVWEADLNRSFDMVKQSTGVTIHGIIGTNFLTEYKFILDFDELIIYKKNPLWKQLLGR